MTATDVYEASHTKRCRATKTEMEERRRLLYELAREQAPASVRNIFYRAVVSGVPGIGKNDSGYNKVQRLLAQMRRDGDLPFGWITDSTRWMRKPTTYGSVEDALRATAEQYRRNLWSRSPVRVEVWCESESIAGVIHPVTELWDVPLLPVRGFSSISFTQSAAVQANDTGLPLHVLYIGDHDPHGLDIEHNLRRDLAEWLTVDHQFERIGVTWEQVEEMSLPGTTPKASTRYGYPISVEAEALPARWLRGALHNRLHSYHDPDELEVLEVVEQNERETLLAIAEWRVA